MFSRRFRETLITDGQRRTEGKPKLGRAGSGRGDAGSEDGVRAQTDLTDMPASENENIRIDFPFKLSRKTWLLARPGS